ncbi:hypothetical protein AUTU_33500 [Aureibacter tunicatorum]|nr:hypothetical protein AUTU_33500 [Aureibacter tunicatorum]
MIVWVLLISCQNTSNKSKKEMVVSSDVKHDKLLKPVKSWRLPTELKEISGLDYYSKEILACVQDEEGIIFLYDLEKGNIVKRIHFAGDGDYEGIAYDGKSFYVVRSDGKLFVVSENSELTKEYDIGFKSNVDVEGICLFESEKLLLAVKDIEDKKAKKKKCIYVYDLASKKLEDKEWTCVKEKEYGNKFSKIGFSGLSINPITNQLYVLSHRSKEMFIFSHKGNLKKIKKLKAKQFEQAEGICFSPSGQLFISSEGVKQPAMLFQFDKD